MAFATVQGKLGHRQGDITVALRNGTLQVTRDMKHESTRVM